MKQNRKIRISLFATAGVLALVGTGFAAWTISQGAKKETTGNISADATVKNNALSIDATSDWDTTDNAAIHFGPKVSDTITNPWLTVDSGSTPEDLTATYHLVVKYSDKEPASVAATLTATEGYNTALTNKYVGALPTTENGIAIGTGVKDAEHKIVTYDIKVTFSWGSAFGNINPYEYYNKQTFTSDLASKAKTAIEGLSSLNSTSFTLTITVS